MSHRTRALDLAERLDAEAAIDAAFAPLRARRSTVGATRVRAAVRWGRGGDALPEAVPWAGAMRRISELGMAVGMSAFVFAASLSSVPIGDQPSPAHIRAVEVVEEALPVPRVTKPLEEDRYIRWLKLGRDVTSLDLLDATIPTAASAFEPELDPRLQLILRTLIPVR